jgi:hypothetical protein
MLATCNCRNLTEFGAKFSRLGLIQLDERNDYIAAILRDDFSSATRSSKVRFFIDYLPWSSSADDSFDRKLTIILRVSFLTK